MSRLTSQEFVVARASDELWNFKIKDNDIQYRVQNTDGTLADSKKLLENAIGDFSIDIDASDNIHLVCINKRGELLYFMHNGEHWYNKQLATFPIDKYRIRYLTISTWDKLINVFYAVSPASNPSVWSIQHNFWNGSRWESFRVVRITGDSYFSPFFTGYDHTGSIHLVYKAPRLGVYQLYYCRFRPDYLIWGNPEKITTANGDNIYPYMLTDNKDTLHLAWSLPVKNNLLIKYLQRTKINYPRAAWRNETLISSVDTNKTQPLLYIIGNSLWTVWNQKDTLYGSFSYDEGNNWTSPFQIDIPPDSQLKIYNLSFNNKRYSSIIARLSYGFEKNNSIVIPVIDEALNKKAKETIPIKKEETNIDDVKVKEYALETKNYVGKLMEEVEKLEIRKKEIEGTISKQVGEMTKTYKSLELLKEDLNKLGEELEHTNKENATIVSTIKKWETKYLEHQKLIEDMSKKYEELSENVKSLSGKSLIQRILDYFS